MVASMRRAMKNPCTICSASRTHRSVSASTAASPVAGGPTIDASEAICSVELRAVVRSSARSSDDASRVNPWTTRTASDSRTYGARVPSFQKQAGAAS